jgi:copper resistance protein C
VTLQSLDRGAYTVIWRVLSIDGNVTEGRYTFGVE